MIYWLGFAACAAAILVSGSRLSRYGDIIAEKYGLSRSLTGMVLLATSTSLPELVTGLSSVTHADAPNIAVGDIFGACAFNMFWFALLDAFVRGTPLGSRLGKGNLLAACFGVVLVSLAGMAVAAGEGMPSVGWVGVSSPVFLLVYLAAVRLISRSEKAVADPAGGQGVLLYDDVSAGATLRNYAVHSAVVVAAGALLPHVGKGLAETYGLGTTFVGNVFIAVATSLPELVVSVSALRMGALDLAAGNLLGSNIFNICILAADDLLFFEGPLLASVSGGHAIAAFSAAAMTAVAAVGMVTRAPEKRFFVAWESAAMCALFAANLLFLYAAA